MFESTSSFYNSHIEPDIYVPLPSGSFPLAGRERQSFGIRPKGIEVWCGPEIFGQIFTEKQQSPRDLKTDVGAACSPTKLISTRAGAAWTFVSVAIIHIRLSSVAIPMCSWKMLHLFIKIPLTFHMFCVLFNMFHLVIHLLNKDAEVVPKFLPTVRIFAEKLARPLLVVIATGHSDSGGRTGQWYPSGWYSLMDKIRHRNPFRWWKHHNICTGNMISSCRCCLVYQ